MTKIQIKAAFFWEAPLLRIFGWSAVAEIWCLLVPFWDIKGLVFYNIEKVLHHQLGGSVGLVLDRRSNTILFWSVRKTSNIGDI